MSGVKIVYENSSADALVEVLEPDRHEEDCNILSFQDIRVNMVKKSLLSKLGKHKEGSEKVILDNISGQFKSGRLCALMGSSGSGKTTLMNALSDNVPRELSFSGKIRYNGFKQEIRKISSYIQQVDLFYIRLTVKEHLKFHIKLYSKKGNTKEDQNFILSELLKKFSLTKCLNTTIGDGIRVAGLSGGERKRLSIASEIVKDPKIIFADEPTSGLDIYMAASVIDSLRLLADQGTMVIVTIHQPSWEIFKNFDDICLLSAGRLICLNTLPNVMKIFERAGFVCPSMHNPADFIIFKTTIVPGDEENCLNQVKLIEEASIEFSQTSKGVIENEESVPCKPKDKEDRVSQLVQLRELIIRDFRSIKRESLFFYVRIVQNTITALVCGFIFFHLKFSATSLSNIFGVLFFFVTSQTFQNVFSVINNFSTEIDLFTRENRKKLYRHTPYFVSKFLTEIPLIFLFCFIFIAVSYFMVGLRPTAPAFFLTFAILFLVGETAISYTHLITILIPSIKAAPPIASSILMVFLLMGGFLVSSDNIPVAISWISYLSWFKYAIEALSIVQLNDNLLICDATYIEYCKNHTHISATYTFPDLGYSETHLTQNILSMLALLVGYRLLAYLALTLRVRKRR